MVIHLPIPLILVAGLVYRYVRNRYRYHGRQKGQKGVLFSSMQDFVMGVDRSAAYAGKIHHILMTEFAQEPEFEELLTATGSFVPGGKPPFLDEAALAQKFAEFLATRYQIYLDPGQTIDGVWPPPPQRSGHVDLGKP